MTTVLIIFVVVALTFIAVVRFLVKLDDAGVLGILRSRPRRPTLVVLSIQIALVLFAATMMSITHGWAAVIWKIIGLAFTLLLILSVQKMQQNLARISRRPPVAEPEPAAPPEPPPVA